MNRFYNSLKLILVVLLLSLAGGCMLPRKHSALKPADQPSVCTALLPIETPSSYRNGNVSREKVIRTGDAVLDTLARSKEGSLMGPSQVTAILGSHGIPACLSWKTLPLDIGVQSNDVATVHLLARRLGVRRVVRCWIDPPEVSGAWELAGDRGVFELAKNSTCYVSVNMQLIDLDSLGVINTSRAASQAKHTAGFLMLPMYVGTTFGRAVDQAERTALSQLFKPPTSTAKE